MGAGESYRPFVNKVRILIKDISWIGAVLEPQDPYPFGGPKTS